jgi:hypothetical protein
MGIVLIVIVGIILVRANRGNKINVSEIYSSGIPGKGEEIAEFFRASRFGNEQGVIVFTNRRIMFLQKASGWGSKGFNLKMSESWGDVGSVSTTGYNKFNLDGNLFTCLNAQDVARKIVENKNNYEEKTVIEAKTVIIEEANKDNAMKILQKRLARGEITLEEFNKLITRT